MTYLGFGSAVAKVGFAMAALTVLFGILGAAARSSRFTAAARNAMIAGGVLAPASAVCLIFGFIRGAYDVRYIFNYSERKLPLAKKIACLWAGLDGSILFWAAILGLVGAALAIGFSKRNVEPARRRLEPFVYTVYGFVQSFFLAVIAFVADPFQPLGAERIAELTQRGLANGGMPVDGAGLNPLLDTYWMMYHPPSVYLGFILYTVPFAYGAAALLAGEFSLSWIKATRGWTMLAWIFNTNGIILGGMWAYEVLGWGGYWAWDPVENASFLPWLAGTAFLHSVMVQERRGMLVGWNALLVCLTFILSIFGTYLTRSGIVSSVHAFASGEVGTWFLWFLVSLIAFSGFLLALRLPALRTTRTIDTLFCREAVFILNNFVLLGLAVAITILVLWPKISFEFLGQAVTVGVPVYNAVCTPLFVVLFLFTAVGPMLGWVRTTASNAVANLLVPAIVALLPAGALQWYFWDRVRGGTQGELFTFADHVYPTFLVTWLCCVIVLALGWEVVRTAHRAGASSGRGFFGSLSRMLTLQNRRYGGYLVHVGLATLGISVVISSMYRTTTEVSLEKGAVATVSNDERYALKLHAMKVEPARPGQAYNALRADVSVLLDGAEIARMEPEARFYPVNGLRMDPAQSTTEVQIARLPAQDVYVYFERPEISNMAAFPPAQWFERKPYRFTVYRNPCMWLLWAGWTLMIVGGIYAALPLGGKKVGLAG